MDSSFLPLLVIPHVQQVNTVILYQDCAQTAIPRVHLARIKIPTVANLAVMDIFYNANSLAIIIVVLRHVLKVLILRQIQEPVRIVW